MHKLHFYKFSKRISTVFFLCFLLIFISVNLGLVNLLPIPGLDGAQIILLLVEAIRRKPLSRKAEAYIKLAGFAALLALFVLLTFQDIASIFRGGR